MDLRMQQGPAIHCFLQLQASEGHISQPPYLVSSLGKQDQIHAHLTPRVLVWLRGGNVYESLVHCKVWHMYTVISAGICPTEEADFFPPSLCLPPFIKACSRGSDLPSISEPLVLLGFPLKSLPKPSSVWKAGMEKAVLWFMAKNTLQ